jgi:ABC-type bacteriocin/lantibiotic exporter with double-glycine peptidase domain
MFVGTRVKKMTALLPSNVPLRFAVKSVRMVWQMVMGKSGWRVVMIGGVTSFVLVGTQLISPLLTKYLINRVLIPHHQQTLSFLLLGIIAVGLTQIGASLGQSVALERIIQSRLLQLRMRWIRSASMRLLRPGDLEATSAGFSSRLLNDLDSLAREVLGAMISVPRDTLWLILLIVLMARLDSPMTVAAFVMVPAVGAMELWLARLQATWTQRFHHDLAATSGAIVHALHLSRVVHAFQTPSYLNDLTHPSLVQLQNDSVRRIAWLSTAQALSSFMMFLGPLTLLLYGSWLELHGRLSLGALLAFYAFSMQVYLPVKGLLQGPSRFARIHALSVGILNDMGPCPMSSEFGPSDIGLPVAVADRVSGADSYVRLSEVVVGEKDTRAGSDPKPISLILQPGSRLWIQGPNGSGKSHWISVIGQLIPPIRGEIVVHGRTGWALQPPQVSRDTLENNIRWGRPALDLTQAENILAVLGHDMGCWSQGWQTPIGTAGRDYLSDGLRQIVSLTRALADSPNILFLDEPFIYLDTRATRGLIDLLAHWEGIVVFSHHGALPIGFPEVTHRFDLPSLRVIENTTGLER